MKHFTALLLALTITGCNRPTENPPVSEQLGRMGQAEEIAQAVVCVRRRGDRTLTVHQHFINRG
jgi:hypothetical protein